MIEVSLFDTVRKRLVEVKKLVHFIFRWYKQEPELQTILLSLLKSNYSNSSALSGYYGCNINV